MKSLLLATVLLAATSVAAGAADIALWARSRTEGYVTPLVKAWNETHADKVALTLIPNEQFVAKIGTAIAGGTPPDLMSIDLIYVPAFARAEQLTDVTAQAKALPYLDRLMGSHLRLATYEGKLYAVPFSAEGSFLMYNKALFRKAGLNPDKPPQSWAEIRDAAAKITALGDGTYGYYFPGNCAGCNVFTFLPAIWAEGGDILSEDGMTPTFTHPAVKAALSWYRDLWASKLVMPSARTDGGENWTASPATGKVGIWPGGAFTLGALKRTAPGLEIGVAFIPGSKAGTWSSFAGGDSIAIPQGTKNARLAWDFIQWSFSPEVQIEILSKNSAVPVRTDLADNKYSQQDPRYVTAAQAMAKGRTPYSFVYNDLFNSPQGPFLRMLQKAVFDGDIDGAIREAQASSKQIIDTGK
jgi:multiple sugar transport system substrate-binding protein